MESGGDPSPPDLEAPQDAEDTVADNSGLASADLVEDRVMALAELNGPSPSDQEEAKRKTVERRRQLIAVIVVLLVGALVGAVAGLLSSADDDDASVAPSQFPSKAAAPSPAPSLVGINDVMCKEPTTCCRFSSSRLLLARSTNHLSR